MDRMEKKKRRKPEIGYSDVVKVIPVEPVMQRIEAIPLTKEQEKVEQTKSKEEPTVPVVKKKRNSCFLC